MNAFAGILAALYDRQSTDRGQHVDVTLAESQLGMLAGAAEQPLNRPDEPWEPFRHPIWRAKDGYLTLNLPAQQWPRVAEAFWHPELAESRVAYDERMELVAAWIAERTVAEAADALERAGAPYGIVRSLPEALADPYFEERGMVIELPDPLDGTIRAINTPIHLSNPVVGPVEAAPLAGQHSRELLRELLGYDETRIGRLLGGGAVTEQTPP